MNVLVLDESTVALLKTHIPDFADLLPETIAEVTKFNWLWPCFEALQCETRANADSLDAFSSRLSARNLESDRSYCDASQYFLKRYSSQTGRLNLLCPSEQYHQNDRRVIAEGTARDSDPLSKSKALCRIVYRLRNNLFHGTKGHNGLQDQHENFTNANTLLRFWINYDNP